MTTRILITNCRPFDSRRGSLRPLSTLVIEDDRIVEQVAEPRTADAGTVIDAGGRVAVPGLIDAHVHVTAVSHDVWRMVAMPPSLITAQSTLILQGMLMRGFTTVRDAAGPISACRRRSAAGCSRVRGCTSPRGR